MIKQILKSWVSEKQLKRIDNVRRILSQFRKGTVFGLQTFLEWTILYTIRLLPLNFQAHIKEKLRPTGYMDYERASIRMSVNSSWQLYRLNSAQKEPEIIDWLEQNIREQDVFYDIGTNIGAYSLVAAARGAAKVYAFEPGFANYSELCENTVLNRINEKIICLPVALGSKSGLREIFYSDLRAGAARHSWNEENAVLKNSSNRQSILTFALDDLIKFQEFPLPSLIKIDVDGPEYDILLGAQHTLIGTTLRSLFIEVQDPEAAKIVTLLEGCGMKLDRIHRRKKTFANYIFNRP